jgi:hypothetical protein
MSIGEVERQLRAGPPEEELYRVRALVLDDDGAIAVERLAGPGFRPGTLAARRQAAAFMSVIALFAAGFVVGRLAAPPSMTEAPGAVSGGLVQPAFVSDALRQAFYSGVDRQHAWLACAVTSIATCTDAPSYRTVANLGDNVWPLLSPVTLPAGHVIVGIELDPASPVAAYLSPAGDPSAAGPELVPTMIYPGDTFLDLGSLAPGRYVLSVLTAPTAPVMSGQIAIGIVVG